MLEYVVKNFTANEIIVDKKILKEIIDLSNIAYLDPKNYAKDNYETENWEAKPHTLLHIILKKDRFKEGNGVFSLLYDNNIPVAYAGAYKHEDDPNILICLVRAFILQQYRAKNLLGNYILPSQMKYAKKNNYEYCWLTYNEYNKYIFNSAKRASQGKATILGTKVTDLYKQAKYYEEPLIIQKTKQYVIEIKTELAI
jgi:hypothetical protein